MIAVLVLGVLLALAGFTIVVRAAHRKEKA